MRTYLAGILAAVLVLTGQSMAIARGAPGPAGAIVLCTGTGPVQVLVDEDGAPVAPPHICPDCALHVLVAIAAPDTGVQSRNWTRGTRTVLRMAVRHDVDPIASVARGPPVSV